MKFILSSFGNRVYKQALPIKQQHKKTNQKNTKATDFGEGRVYSAKPCYFHLISFPGSQLKKSIFDVSNFFNIIENLGKIVMI